MEKYKIKDERLEFVQVDHYTFIQLNLYDEILTVVLLDQIHSQLLLSEKLPSVTSVEKNLMTG